MELSDADVHYACLLAAQAATDHKQALDSFGKGDVQQHAKDLYTQVMGPFFCKSKEELMDEFESLTGEKPEFKSKDFKLVELREKYRETFAEQLGLPAGSTEESMISAYLEENEFEEVEGCASACGKAAASMMKRALSDAARVAEFVAGDDEEECEEEDNAFTEGMTKAELLKLELAQIDTSLIVEGPRRTGSRVTKTLDYGLSDEDDDTEEDDEEEYTEDGDCEEEDTETDCSGEDSDCSGSPSIKRAHGKST